jgi:hypothetical protein
MPGNKEINQMPELGTKNHPMDPHSLTKPRTQIMAGKEQAMDLLNQSSICQ